MLREAGIAFGGVRVSVCMSVCLFGQKPNSDTETAYVLRQTLEAINFC